MGDIDTASFRAGIGRRHPTGSLRPAAPRACPSTIMQRGGWGTLDQAEPRARARVVCAFREK